MLSCGPFVLSWADVCEVWGLSLDGSVVSSVTVSASKVAGGGDRVLSSLITLFVMFALKSVLRVKEKNAVVSIFFGARLLRPQKS